MQDNLIQLFPMDRRPFWAATVEKAIQLQEIRLRVQRPIIVISNGKEHYLDAEGNRLEEPHWAYCAGQEEMLALMNHICRYSLYAYEDELRQGFITVAGGHRVGVAGQVVMEGNGGVRTMKHISYINIRVAHQIKGVSDKVLPRLYENGVLKNCLIVSPPGCGKTTLLRDLIRQISNGNAFGQGMCVGVVDERSEIAGSYMGKPQNDIGMRTDVLDACPKVYGMMLLIRALSPKVIAIDELGSSDDVKALELVMHCGSKILATIHGTDMESIITKRFMKEILKDKAFERYILLGKHNGKCIIEGIYDQNFRIFSDFSGYNRMWS